MAAISGEPLRLRAWHRPFDYETATGRIGSTPGEGNSRPSWKDVFYGKRPSASAYRYLESWQRQRP